MAHPRAARLPLVYSSFTFPSFIPQSDVEAGGIPTYVSEPENESNTKSKAIVFLVDIFGWQLPNVRLLADSYAKAGFTAYIPDVHEGDSLPISFLQDVEPPLPTRESSKPFPPRLDLSH